MKKKLLSVLVVFAMALTLTTVAFAQAENTSTSLADSDKVTWSGEEKPNDAVTVTTESTAAEVTLSGAVNLDKTITVSGTGGLKLKGSGSDSLTATSITVTNSTLEIENTVSTVTGSIILNAGSVLTVDSKTYTARDNSVTLTLTGNTVSGGNITISSGDGAIEATTGIVTTNTDKAVTVAGGTVKVKSDGTVTGSTGASVTIGDVTFADNGTSLSVKAAEPVEITDAKIESLANNKSVKVGSATTVAAKETSSISVSSGTTLTVDSGSVTVTGNLTGATVKSNATLNIDSATYKATQDATVNVDSNNVTLTDGKIELGGTSPAVTPTGKAKVAKTDGSGTVTVSSDGTVEIGNKDTTVTVGTGKTYKSNDAAATIKVGATEGDTTLSTGKVELGTGAKVTLGSGTSAKNGTSGVEISGEGIIVEGASGHAVVTGDDHTATINKKTYALSGSGNLEIADESGEATLTTGSVTIGTDTAIKYSEQTYTAKSATTKLTVSGSDLELASGSVEVPDGQSIKVGTGKLTAAGSAKATVGISGDAATVTDGKVSLDTNSKVKVQGKDVSGNGIEVDKDGKVEIGTGETAKIGEDSFLATGGTSTLTVGASDVTAEISGGTLKVTDDDKSLNVTYKNITFKGDEYTLSDDSGTAKVAVANDKSVVATFKGSDNLKVDNTPKVNGEPLESDGTLTGANGASVKLAGGESDTTVTGENGTTVTKEGTVTAPATPPSTSPSTSTPSTTVDKPTTDASTGETKVDVNTNSTTSGTTAKATVSDTNMDKAVNSAVDEAKKQGTAPVVEVEVKTSDKADSLNVTLPAASLEKLAEAEDASLIVTSDIAQVALDNTALTALAEQAAGNTVTLEVAPVAASALNEAQAEAVGEADVVDLSLVSNGVVIHDYNNGKITVTLPYKLGEGKDPASVQVYFLDDNGALTPCATSYDSKAGKVTFTTVHLSKYVIADADLGVEKDCPSAKYADVDQTKWYHEGVDYAIKNGLMNGTGADTFAPNATTTRAMIVTILYRLDGEPAVTESTPFEDVPDGKWYADAISWAAANGIVTGYSETQFGPNDPITREQMAAILYRYASYKGYDVSVGEDTNILSYTDASSISEYAIPAMQWAAGSGLMEGTSAATLSPKGSAVRAQAATILMRFCESVAK